MATDAHPEPARHLKTPGAEGKAHLSVEVERKFEVPDHWGVPDFVGVGRVTRVEGPVEFHQEATYLDSLGLDLLAAKRTLRRRTGGSDAGWHLKSPGSGESRTEMTAPLGAGTARVPDELREEVNRVVGPVALVPVCLLRNVRSRRTLYGLDENGNEIVLAVVEDDSVEGDVLIGEEFIRRWREVEVELVDGTADDLERIGEALLASGSTVSTTPSKVGRALQGVGLFRDLGSSGDLVMMYVVEQVGVIQAFEPRVRRDEPDAVHKMRVATRRLRSTLRTYRSLFDRSFTGPLRTELKWLAGLLGGPRDGEVLAERIGGALEALDPLLVRGRADERILESLRHTHADAFGTLIEGLDSARFTSLLELLNELVVDPPFTGAARLKVGDNLPGLVGESAQRVVDKADEAVRLENPEQRHEAVHEVRKLAKVARYAAEAAGSSAGERVGKVVSAWTRVQDSLGEHQDSVVAREVLEKLYRDARRANEDTFTYGVLICGEARFAAAIEDGMDSLIAQARRATAHLG